MSEPVQPKISIIVPCYNAVDKLAPCLSSLRRIAFDTTDYEVIFVDDASTDTTVAVLRAACAEQPNWRLTRLERNSGSPSLPRNTGMKLARGDYVFFLDCDDEILPDTLRVHYHHALATDADIVRGYLLTDNGRQRKSANRIAHWGADLTRKERIAAIIGQQSTTVTSLVRLKMLRLWDVTWPEDLLMGEDTVFLTEVLSIAHHIEYIAHPTFVYHKKLGFTPSATQSYGARELANHLIVWRRAQAYLHKAGVDYRQVRLKVGLYNVLKMLTFRNRRDFDWEDINAFKQYLDENTALIDGFKYAPRLRQILEAAQLGDAHKFAYACRPRLIIAGRDLRHIRRELPALSPFFDIRLDAHPNGDGEARQKLLIWAERIWCERLDGIAAWYSRHKTSEQRMVVRVTHPELERQWRDDLDIDQIDAVIVPSVTAFEQLLTCFAALPREKARLMAGYMNENTFANRVRDLFEELV